MQHEIHEPLPLLRSDGRLTEPGWARQPFWRYRRAAVRAASWRIKEWDYYAVVSPEGHGFALTASNLGYAGLYAVCFIDLQQRRSWQLDRLQALPLGRHALPESPLEGEIRFAHERLSLHIQRLEGVHRLTFVSPYMEGPGGRGLNGELYFRQPAHQESMNIATHWAHNTRQFYCNTKLNCLPVEGEVRLAGKRYAFSPTRDLGCLDWGRGVWPWRSTWYWASASGFVEGEPLGLNFGYGFSDRTPASENLLLYRGHAHKLGQVRFAFDPRHWLKPWKIGGDDGRVELEFVPALDRNSHFNALLIASEQHQVFGHYRGRVTLDNGQVLQLNHLPGFAEEVRNRW